MSFLQQMILPNDLAALRQLCANLPCFRSIQWWILSWMSVVLQRSLALTKDQRTELCQLRQLFVQKLSSIVDQRREVHQVLLVSLPGCSTDLLMGPVAAV